MADFNSLLPDEQKLAMALDPRKSKVRTVNWDKEGNIHMLIKFDAEYVTLLGINKDRLATQDSQIGG